MKDSSMEERTVRYRPDRSKPEPRMSEKALRMSDEEIMQRAAEDPDMPDIMAPDFWDHAEIVSPKPKSQITLRLDADLLDWFKEGGKGYQTRINAVLRSYVEAQKQAAE
jgi:uncharacterized protein (DUF4415 family)